MTGRSAARAGRPGRVSVLAVSIEDAVCRIRLNRPDKLNPLSEEVRRELHGALQSIADEPAVRVAVIEGAGRAFSAGADLADRREVPEEWAARRHAYGGWQRLLDLLEAVPQVTVAKLHGHVIGGAALLAAACDLRIAAADVAVAIPELAIGIPLTWAGIPRLVREIGLPVARDLVMTGRRLDADEALACGFVQRVVAREELDAATEGLVDELLAMPHAPLAMTRAMFSALSRERVTVAGWADADLLMWSGREPESRAAAEAYVRRRLR